VKIIKETSTKKECVFAKAQEECRKEIKRAFDVLLARFAIVRSGPGVSQAISLSRIMSACAILHNMIIEDENDMDLKVLFFRQCW
jgi:hypothetical protein